MEFLNKVNWKDLLALTDEQNQAVDAAIHTAQETPEILSALRTDQERLTQGTGGFSRTAGELRILYGEELYRLHAVLVLLTRLPWLLEQYKAHDISDKALRDTLSDVRIWMDVCKKRTGYHGLLEYGWLCNHFSFKLFRIGRLQFVYQPCHIPAYVYRNQISGVVMALCPNGAMYQPNGDGAGVNGNAFNGVWLARLREENGFVEGFPIHRSGHALRSMVRLDLAQWECVLKPGDPVLDMHIAEGCPLNAEAVGKSLDQAPEFFRQHLGADDVRAMTCSSWLLDDNIGQMQPNGNIASFQRRFYLIPALHAGDWQTRERAFGNPDVDILTAECRTSLQRSIAAWYESGRYCRNSAGLILV